MSNTNSKGTDKHHDHEFGLDFDAPADEIDDVLAEVQYVVFGDSDEFESEDQQQNTYVDPVIENFRIGLIYEIFTDCIRNSASNSFARSYFNADKACVLVIRCADSSEKMLYMAALDHILEGHYRQKFRSGQPESACALDGDVVLAKSVEKEMLEKIFEYRRLFIFTVSETKIPETLNGFIDSAVQLQTSKDAIECAIQKYIKEDFHFAHQHSILLDVPVAQLIAIFTKGRRIEDSLRLAKQWLHAQARSDVSKKSELAAQGPTLDDLHGLGAAGEWGKDLALDLADWKAGKISWSEVDRGVLICGAPGTGKTTFAAALARTCGVKFIGTSMAQWQAKGHLGDYLKAMRKSFEDAQKLAPCILFVDEFDSAGDRNSKASDNDDYIRRAVNGLLECLDGIGGREGVIVVGATNYPDKVDEALRRPGRLDKLVEIPLPDAAARAGILRFHLKGNLDGVDLAPVVQRTKGMAGAWLESLVRDARRSSRRQRRELKLVDLVQACPARERMPEASLRQSAYHEAGHAVIALELGKAILSAKVTRDFLAEESSFHGGSVQISREPEHIYLRSKSYSLTMIKQLLGGLAAEEHFLGERNDGGWGDLREATFWAARQWLSTGQQDSLLFLSEPDVEPVLAALKSRLDVQAKVETLLQECMTEVKAVIEKRQDDVRLLAAALVERGSLSGAEITELLAPKAKIFSLPRSKNGQTHDDVEEYAYECA